MASDEKTSTFYGWSAPSDEQARKARLADEANHFAERFEQLVGVESVGDGYFASQDGRLWKPALELDPPSSGHEGLAFTLRPDLEIAWLRRPDKGPRTVDDLAKRDAQNAEAAKQAEKEREAQLRELRKSAVPVTASLFEPGLATLAEAGERVRNAGGVIELTRGDRLLVRLPRSALGVGVPATSAAKLLYLAEAEVVACVKGKAALPDREVLPSGALAPE